MNIKDIANLSGVSAATVSRYLNGGYVSHEKKDAIQKVIRETGYHPSRQAQMLRTRRTNVIGVMVPEICEMRIAGMLEEITDVLYDAGYQCLLGNTKNQDARILNCLEEFRNYQAEGILLVGQHLTDAQNEVLQELPLPSVSLRIRKGQGRWAARELLRLIRGGTKEL